MSTLENAQENPLPSCSSDLSKKPVTKKKSRRVLSIEDKIKVIEALRGKSQAEVSKMFQPPLPQSTVATILKNRKKIMSAYEEGMLYKVKSRKTMKQSSYPDLDIALSRWFKKVRSMNIPVTGPLLAEKARYFAEELGYEKFKASNGFLEGFKKRHGITGQTISGEEKSVDPEIVDTWSERLPDICRGYDRKDRFNADETGFYWRATPKETLNFKGKKCSGGKQSKERVTVMVACNQDGTEKLPLLVIGKSAKPRCFNHSNMDLLPVMYRSQKNAWIDSELFEEWVRKVDRKMKTANRNILLFIDNCTAHVSVRGLTNTKLFFSQQTVQALQPADQGIIKNLKFQYRQTMIRNMLQFLDENKPIKDINLKDSVFMMAKSWDNVTATTIKNCWKKANFPDEVTEPTHDPFESSDEEDVETTIERGAGTIWERLVRHCPSMADLSFSQFASLDDEIVTEKQLSAEDATREALEAARPRESQDECVEESDPEDDEIFVMEPKLLAPLQASENVRALRDFVMSFKESGAREHEFLRSLSRMEDAFLKLNVRGKRQTRLQEYF